jgi:hypothetical protein
MNLFRRSEGCARFAIAAARGGSIFPFQPFAKAMMIVRRGEVFV